MQLLKPNFDLFACGQNCKAAHVIPEPFIPLSLQIFPLTPTASLYVTPSGFFAFEDVFFFTLCSPPKCEGRESPQPCTCTPNGCYHGTRGTLCILQSVLPAVTF